MDTDASNARDLTRRGFITGAAAAGMIVAAGSLTASAFAADTTSASASGSASASASGSASGSAASSADVSVAESASISVDGAVTGISNVIGESRTIWDSGDEDLDNILPLDPPDAYDEEADIVVVGTGGGGLAASLLAAQNGASVITIEKLPEVGGNTRESSYFACPGGSKFQNEQGIAFDPATLIQTYWPFYRYSADQRLMQAMVVRGHITIDWLAEVGVEWDFDSTFTGRSGNGLCWKGADDGGLTIRMTEPVCQLVYQKAQDAGVEFQLSTEVTGLIKDGSRIAGVRTEDGDGNEHYIKADTAVILCAGGFESNRTMLSVYCPTFAKGCGASMAYPTNDGKIVRMGWGAGAQLKGFDSFAVFDGGPDWHDFGDSWCQSLYSGYTALIRSPWLSINEQGERYMYLDNNGTGGEMKAAFQGMIEMAQPGNRGYVIFDKGWEDRVPAFGQTGCRRPVTEDMPNIDRAPEGECPHNWIDGANKAIENGWIRSADTIEELAGKMGLDPTLLQNAVDNWNTICDSGEDTEFGYDSSWLIRVENPPFYGAKIGSFSPSCGCGLAVNTGMQVMGTDGNPIEGLYAAFCTAGGAWGESGYGFASPLGVNHLSWWSGYVAAETALGLTPRE